MVRCIQCTDLLDAWNDGEEVVGLGDFPDIIFFFTTLLRALCPANGLKMVFGTVYTRCTDINGSLSSIGCPTRFLPLVFHTAFHTPYSKVLSPVT